MPVNIIENFKLGTNLPLDSRYIVNSYNDVSLYWYEGMQVFQTSDQQLYWYNGSTWIAVVDTSLSGNFATIEYVDGSLAYRDISINVLFNENDDQDTSILSLNGLIQINITDISNLESSIGVLDSLIQSNIEDISNIEASIGVLNYWNITQDASIINLRNEDIRQDGSLNALFIENDIQDTSIIRIDGSINDLYDTKVNRSGDTMTGDLLIETDLSVNGKTNTGQFNVSGLSFPGSPAAGDIFYRSDLVQMFLYDASRGKWLSIDRATYNAGVERALQNTTTYMEVGSGDMSSITGFRMPKNGTILGATVQNRVNATDRTMSIRINDVSVYAVAIPTGTLGGVGTNANADFNSGDIIQIAIEEGTTTLRDIFASFEVAWRE